MVVKRGGSEASTVDHPGEQLPPSGWASAVASSLADREVRVASPRVLHASDPLQGLTTKSDDQPHTATKTSTQQKSEFGHEQIYIYTPPPSLGRPPVEPGEQAFVIGKPNSWHYITNIMSGSVRRP